MAGPLQACTPPCDAPILYRPGTIDERFEVSRTDLLWALRRAEEVWEKAAGRDLFRYADDGDLAVNLVYDDRQVITQENAQRTATIEEARTEADRARTRYERAKARYESSKQDYDTVRARHEERLARHNRSVQAWNDKGGAPPAERTILQKEEAEINSAATLLEDARQALNSLAEDVNGLSDRYNRLIETVNANVAAVNTVAGQEFKQGRYSRDAGGRRIDVFEFLDRDDLIHVLAHELGHALGLEHNQNPDSIMYGVNSSRTAKLADEDAAALKEKCRL